MPGLDDLDRYIDEHGIPPENYPAAFALWLAEIMGGPVTRFKKVEREPPAGRGRDPTVASPTAMSFAVGPSLYPHRSTAPWRTT